MKGFMRGILTIFITIMLICFAIVNSMKEVLIDTTDKIVKKEIKTSVLELVETYVSENDNVDDDVLSKVEREVDNNSDIKKLMDKYYDKIFNILSGSEEIIEIDATKEIENLIADSEKILKDYGISLTEEDKKELLSVVSSDEVNKIVNDAIVEVKSNMSSDVMTLINTYSFLTSPIFKVILIVLVVVSLLFIALLKKSFFGWLANFGISSIVAGITVGIILPMLVKVITDGIKTYGNLDISISILNIYGYIFIIIGILSIVTKVIISKVQKNLADGVVEEN